MNYVASVRHDIDIPRIAVDTESEKDKQEIDVVLKSSNKCICSRGHLVSNFYCLNSEVIFDAVAHAPCEWTFTLNP